MRNLKRALSLTLASVMLLGMMVVGSSAAAGYDDVADTDNVEAIEVLQAIEVMVGDERGFGPERPVNRAEMAVVMGKLLNLDYNYYEATCPFNDVYDWAQGWVGACYANGIVSGRGEGVYDPGTTVTAVEAASMLMRALGYFKYQSDYADGFEVATVRQANTIRLFDGVNSKTNEPLTRNQVAQMALNALKSGVVTPDGNTTNFVDANGNLIGTVGRVNYVYTTSNKSFATAISDVRASSMGSANDAPIVELGEQLYDGKLKMRDALDVFGRPARRWEFDGKEVGAYAKKELLVKEYVGKVTGKDLYDLLGADTIKEYDLLVSLDGVSDAAIVRRVSGADSANLDYVFDKADLNRNNKAAVGNTGVGVETEVFVDHEKDQIYVAVINTYLARATKDYDSKKEEAALTVYAVDKDSTSGEYVKTTKKDSTFKPGVEEFSLVEDMKKDDAFLVTIADGTLQTIAPAEVLSAVSISAFKNQDYVVSGGTNYSYTTTAKYKDGDLDQYTGAGNNGITNLKDRTYNIFLDAYGNLIGLEEIDAAKNYVFISGIDLNGSNLINRTADVNAIFLDGTVATVKVNMTKSEIDTEGDLGPDALLNTWCTYTKNGDLYTLKEVYKAGDSWKQIANGTPESVKKGEAGNDTSLAQFHQFNTDRSQDSKAFDVDIKRLRLDGGGTSTDGFRYVYGDSDSVYMTAELGELKMPVETVGGNYAIIKDVETLSTGIIDTSVSVFTKGEVMADTDTDKVIGKIVDSAYGVYTLYDKDGTVIAAMIVGEGSSAKDLVYAHTSTLDLESDNGGSSKAANDGLWTWTRRVIRDGQEVTLSEVGDASEELIKMDQYHWYEVKTNGSGEVIKVTDAEEALGSTGRDRFVRDYTKINDVVEEDSVDTVLYQTVGGPNKANSDGFGQNKDETLVVKGNNTLAVNTLFGSGIHFRNNVNVVLQYWNRNTKEIDILAGEGVDDLKDMVDIVNDNTAEGRDGYTETYYVSALIKDGLATDIVIWDSYNTYKRGEVTTRDMVQIDLKLYPTTENEFLVNHELITKDQYRISGDVLYIYAAEGDVVSVHKIDRFEGDVFGSEDLALLHNEKAGSAGISNYGRTLTFTVGAKVVTLGSFDIKHDDVTVTVTGPANVTVDGKAVTGTITVPYNTEVVVTPVKGYTTTMNGVEVKEATTFYADVNMRIVATEESGPSDSVKITYAEKLDEFGDDLFNLETREHAYVVDVEDSLVPLTEVTEGMTLTTDPVQALTLTGDVTPAGTGKWTVDKGAKKVEVVLNDGCSFDGEFWCITTSSGFRFIQSKIDKANEGKARAAVDPAKGWIREAMKDTENVYTIVTGNYTWKGQVTTDEFGTEGFDLILFAPEGAKFEDAAPFFVKAFGANKFDSFDVSPKDDPNPPTPGEDVELKELVDTSKNQKAYTVNYYKTKPDAAKIAEAIKADKKAYSAEWQDAKKAEKLDVKFTADGKAETVTVSWVANTAVHYDGRIVAWTAKNVAASNVAPGVFSKGDVVIGGKEGIQTGTAIKATLQDGKYGVSFSAGDVDDYYLYDAVTVTKETKITKVQYKDEKGVGKDLGSTEAVVNGFSLTITGTGTGLAIKDEMQLLANDKVVAGDIAVKAATAVVYEIKVDAAWADENNNIKFDEAGPVITVTVDGEEYKVAKGKDLTVTVDPYAAYISDEKCASSATIANKNGVLTFATVNTSAKYYRAYPVTFKNTVVGTAKIIEKLGDFNLKVDAATTKTISPGTASYVTPGQTIYIKGVATRGSEVYTLASDVVELTEVKDLVTADKISVYSFVMPETEIEEEDIKAGDVTASIADIKVTPDKTKPLNKADGKATAAVVLTSSEELFDPSLVTVEWWRLDDGTGPSSKPANMKDPKVELTTAGTPNSWTITFETQAGQIIPSGNYYFTVSVGGAKSKVATLTVNAAEPGDADEVKDILSTSGPAEVKLPANKPVQDVTIDSEKKVEVGSNASLKNPVIQGEVTVKEGNVTNPKLDGGKLIIDGTDKDITLAPGSTGEIEINSSKNLSNTFEDLAKELGGTVVETSFTGSNGTMDRAGVQLSGGGTLSTFSGTSIDTVIDGDGGTSAGLYNFKFTAPKSNTSVKGYKIINGERVAMTGVFGSGYSCSGSVEVILLLTDVVEAVEFEWTTSGKATVVHIDIVG